MFISHKRLRPLKAWGGIMRSSFRSPSIFLIFILLQILCVWGAAAQPQGDDYVRAEQDFNSAFSVEQRIQFQVLMTASGQWNTVPAENFTPRLFEAVKRFQSENGFSPTGVPDVAFFDRLTLIATPMLDLWGFQWVSHPSRGYKLWVPLGLGMKQSRSENGLVFDDPKKRIRIAFTTVQNLSIGENFSAMRAQLLKEGAKIRYQLIKGDWFVLMFMTANGVEGYARYHQDASNVTGFSLYWDNRNGNINGDRVATLMSASLRSSMAGASFIDPPHGSAASAGRGTPEQPVERQAPSPRESSPKSEEKISTGTGFFVGRDGSFVTNAHVIEGCSMVLVKTDDAAVAQAKVIARDATNDLAILRLNKTPKRVAKLRVGPRLGESVAAFGFPHANMLSSSGNFTLGNITALAGLGDDSRHLQISTPVQSGNSGGPLLDAYGNVVGVVALKLNALKVAARDGDLPQNVNFAVKSAILASFLDANRVTFEGAISGQKPMEPGDLAAEARELSGFVACH
jgi:serine protease Do